MKKTKTKRKTNKATVKKKPKKYQHHPDHYNTSEEYLIKDLDEDLKEAWWKLKEFGQSLGEQRIYTSGRATMFSKKVCYFFVRPKKKYLEVVIFLPVQKSLDFFKKIEPATKTKFSHTFRLVHADQVEGELTEAIAEAYRATPPQAKLN